MGEKQTKYRAVYALHKPSIEEKVKELLALTEEERKKGKQAIESGKRSMFGGLHQTAFPVPRAIESGKKSMSMLGDRYILDIPIRPEVEFIRPLSDENQRLVNQGGLFTRFPADTDIQSWVQEKFKDDNKDCKLLKIHIPNKDREECLKSLNRMNINHLTLFPDLYGASRFCNLFGEIERY